MGEEISYKVLRLELNGAALDDEQDSSSCADDHHDHEGDGVQLDAHINFIIVFIDEHCIIYIVCIDGLSNFVITIIICLRDQIIRSFL